MFEALNPADIAKWTAYELENSIHIDRFAVRDEAFRRSEAAAKKITKLKKQLAAAEREFRDAERVFNAADRAN